MTASAAVAGVLILGSTLILGSSLEAAQRAPAPPPTAAPAPAPARGGGRRAGTAPTNAELATILDAYAIVQAQRALQLDDPQYGPFVTRLKRLQETRRRGTQSRNRQMQELRTLAGDPAVDEAIIRERVAVLRAAEAESAEALRRAHDEIDEVLNPRQQVRFRQFETQLEARKLDLLIRARAAGKRERPSDGRPK